MTKVLIAGYGSIGKRHIENFLQFKDIQLTVYTKRNDLQLLKKEGIKVSSSLTECLKEKQDIGVVTNETSLHIPIAIKLAKEGLTMMVVTHEMGFARKVADRVVFMDYGKIIEDAPSQDFFGSPRSDRAQEFLSKVLNH